MIHSEPGEFARLNAALAQNSSAAKFVQDNGIAGALRAPPHHQTVFQALLHGRDLRQREIDRFVELGVRPVSLSRPWSMQVDHVVFDGEYFEFAGANDEDGVQVFTMAVISDLGVIDVAAWHPESNRVAVWAGVGWALGERKIGEHVGRHAGAGSLAVFQTVLEWFRADCQGIVIIRKNAAARSLLNVCTLVADDDRHRRELQAIWAKEQGPRVAARTFEFEQQVAA